MPDKDDDQPKKDDGDNDPEGKGGGDPKDGDDADIAADLAKWKALARKHEGEAKKNAEAAKKLGELESANKSELEKAMEAAKASDARAQMAEREILRLRVAAEKGLTPAQAKRLIGETEEELGVDADELLATFQASKEKEGDSDRSLPRRPQERLRSGSTPNREPVEADPVKLAAAVPR